MNIYKFKTVWNRNLENFKRKGEEEEFIKDIEDRVVIRVIFIEYYLLRWTMF